jgi:hypothetical protein
LVLAAAGRGRRGGLEAVGQPAQAAGGPPTQRPAAGGVEVVADWGVGQGRVGEVVGLLEGHDGKDGAAFHALLLSSVTLLR